MAESFQPVGKAGDVSDGGLARFDVGGRRIVIANAGGDLYAFDEDCTHQQCSLAEGDLDGTEIACPCHGSSFDVTTGEVINPPAAEPLRTYPVRVEGDEIVVSI